MNSLVNSASLNNGVNLGPGSANITSTNSNANSNAAQNNHRNLHPSQTPANMMNVGHQQLQQSQSQNQQQQQQAIRNDTLAQLDLSSDLNFDPAAVIDGGGEGQEGLNVSIFLN